MSKSVATKSEEYYKSHKMGGKRGAEDEKDEDGERFLEVPLVESSAISTTVSTVLTTTDRFMSREKSEKRGAGDEGKDEEESILEIPLIEGLTISTVVSTAAVDDFMHTSYFWRHFVEYVPEHALMRLRLATKGYNEAADAIIDEGVESGELIVHGGEDISLNVDLDRKVRRELVTRVAFFLDIIKIGDAAFVYANLVVVDLPEGVKSIGRMAFAYCHSLTTVYFPTTLTSIGVQSFLRCFSLENADLHHTNLQEFGDSAFAICPELKSMTIPDSLQTLGHWVFNNCFKLVPSNFNVRSVDDPTLKVVAFLRSQRFLSATPSPQRTEQFLNTTYFNLTLVEYIMDDTLMTMRLVSKLWLATINRFMDNKIHSGEMLVHDGNGTEPHEYKELSNQPPSAWGYKRMCVKRVVFLLNVIVVGKRACLYALNIVVVDIPEHVTHICERAFQCCYSLTTVSFPTTLRIIGKEAFWDCRSLDNVDLLHTNLRQLHSNAFGACKELKSMTIPSSSNWMESPNHGFLGHYVFYKCAKLVPSNINVDYGGGKEDTTKAILNYLSGRSTVSRNKSQPKTNNKNYA